MTVAANMATEDRASAWSSPDSGVAAEVARAVDGCMCSFGWLPRGPFCVTVWGHGPDALLRKPDRETTDGRGVRCLRWERLGEEPVKVFLRCAFDDALPPLLVEPAP